jgi:cell wall-active antibiotic response 4TMS protein YvqF/putative adhesin
MAQSRQRTSGIFTGLVLLTVGCLLLLHNYRGLELTEVLHWWPLALIFLGAIKLYERTVASRTDDPGSARITGGEILLVVGVITLLSCVVGVEYIKGKVGGRDFPIPMPGDAYPFDLDVAPKTVPANARITIRGGHGDITVRATDTREIRVAGKKNVHAWSENDASRRSGPVSVEIVQNGDGYEIHPTGMSAGDSRINIDMDIQVPIKAAVTVRNEKGNITISDMATPVSVASVNGDVEIRDTASDVTIEMHKGDVKVTDTKGDIKISGKGGQVDVASATGSFTLDGEFYGPIRADKVAKGLRFIYQRTDLTLTSLTGHMEASSGNLEIVDAPGDIALRTNRYSVTIENATGKVKVDNRDGDVSLRFSSPPKADIEVTNTNASISLTLPESASFNILSDCHSCDIESEFSADTLKKTSVESGDSHLEGKYGTARGPKITLRTSYGALSIHKTS